MGVEGFQGVVPGARILTTRPAEDPGAWAAVPSIGSVGDAYDNALPERVIGPYKTEVIARQGPWHGLDPVECLTLVWVAWFNHARLLSTNGYLPPAVYEAQFAASPAVPALVLAHI
jgi:putative transposase